MSAVFTEEDMSDNDKETVVILQPGYLPWLGFFDLLYRADTFVVFDDVQYTSRDWRNRNRIKTAQGVAWLTVPVNSKGSRKIIVRDIRIDNTQQWQRKHLKSFEASYRRAPFFDEVMKCIYHIYDRHYDFLIDVDMDIVYTVMQYLSLRKKILFSSELGIPGKKDEKLLHICKAVGATNYLSGAAAVDYLREDIFKEDGISVEWQNYIHPFYNQLWLKNHGFISYLAIIDMLFNHGKDSLDILSGVKKILRPEGICIRTVNSA